MSQIYCGNKNWMGAIALTPLCSLDTLGLTKPQTAQPYFDSSCWGKLNVQGVQVARAGPGTSQASTNSSNMLHAELKEDRNSTYPKKLFFFFFFSMSDLTAPKEPEIWTK